MNTKPQQLDIWRLAGAMRWFLILCLVLGSAATPALADPYFVFGQVVQVDADDAEDDSIADADLGGDPRPYALIRVFDQSTADLLGEAYSNENGIFTVQYDQPTGATPDIECRVYYVVNDLDLELEAAREDINSFSAVGQFFGAGLRVLSDGSLEYGADGLLSTPGLGIVFTRAGKVTIPWISQDLSLANRPLAGLVDFTGDVPDPITGETEAQELDVFPFVQAPFARRLLIFGAFGLPGGTCAGDQIDYYQVKIKQVDETSASLSYLKVIDFEQPMTKIRTQVTTVPTLTVDHDRVKVGPFAGFDGVTPIDGLYWVNRNVVGGITSTIYAYPDLRVNWVSNAENGLYEISLVYYKYISGAADNPTVQELPMGTCFTPGTADGVHKLYLRVDNQGMTVRYDNIFLRDTKGTASDADDTYFKDGSGDVSDPILGGATDFADEGLCDIMDLLNKYHVEVRFTAHHLGSYMRHYRLSARPNSGATVEFANVTYDPTTVASPPFWEGTPAGGIVVFEPDATVFPNAVFNRCGYIFTLSAHSRLQNGYHFVQSAHRQLAYYIIPQP